MPLLTREILYTAVTRARRSVAIVGAESILRQGIGRRMERFSGIGERLAGLAQK
jgi:exodeoxyribonuclease V alpha subunit